MTPGLYVYGIVATGSVPGPLQEHGVGDGPPVLFDVDGLSAIVSGVDVSEYEGAALERNAATPEWLEQKVRGHEYVLEGVLGHATVVPMRFGSIFSSTENLQEMLTEHAETLREALARVDGRTEWGVKVHCDRPRLVSALAGSAPEPDSGRGYLMQKKARLEADVRAAEAAAEIAAEAHAALSAVASESVAAAPRGHEVLNGAYLVDDARRDAFMGKIEELQRRHDGAFAFEVTGPWSPYSFTSADVGGPRL